MITKDPKLPTKLGCTEPRLGVRVSQQLDADLALPADLQAHTANCLACQLEYRRWVAATKAARRALRPELVDSLLARAIGLRDALYGEAPEAKKRHGPVMTTPAADIEKTDDTE
ncbi:MAG: hypothetical protein AAFV29_01745 [Myxococcota bacterium]